MAFNLDTRLVLNAVTLTGSYVAQTAPTFIETSNVDQVTVDIAYTMGAAETGNSVEVKIEVANPLSGDPVSTDWHQLVIKTVSTSSEDLNKKELTYGADSAAGTVDRISYNLPFSSKFVRFSAKETGIAANGGTLTLKATLRREKTF